MTDMLGRATAAASNAWHECETCPGEMYVREARIVARAALLAALDPEDEALVAAMARRMAAEAGCLQAYERGDSSLVNAWHSSARASLTALRAAAQGVP